MYEDPATADEMPGLMRRRVLQLGGAAAIVGLAGCADDGDDEADDGGGSGDEEDDGESDDGRGETNGEESDDGGDGEDRDGDEESDDEEVDDDDDENGEGQVDRDLTLTSYTNEEYGYELEVPDEWAINDVDPSDIYFYGPDQEELTISTLAYPPETTLDEFVEEVIANLEGTSESEVLGQEDVAIASGEDARIIDWEYSPGFTSDFYQTKILMVITDEGVAYTVDIRTDIDGYDDEFDALGVDVLTSLTITEPPAMSDIDIEEYDTYENEEFGYSLEHPAAWEIAELQDGTVTITDEFGIRDLTVLVDPMNAQSHEELVDEFRTETELDSSMDLLDERSTTLASGHDATILDFNVREDTVYRGSFVLAVDEDSETGYVLIPSIDEALHDETFEEISGRAINSFTIEGAQTQTETQMRTRTLTHARTQMSSMTDRI
ncbi:hypothetical protein, partial [Natronococcus sp. A-GB7]|uniref:hypothetical protein n=1 Tax=Natronococcus sp. A-GB7 TaxID=3037649 RepID=UPI00241ECA4D